MGKTRRGFLDPILIPCPHFGKDVLCRNNPHFGKNVLVWLVGILGTVRVCRRGVWLGAPPSLCSDVT